MKFRDHRGSLKESMATMLDFAVLAAFKTHLEKEYECPIDGIHFLPAGPDRRINWPTTYLVEVDFTGVTPGCPVGWSDSVLNQ